MEKPSLRQKIRALALETHKDHGPDYDAKIMRFFMETLYFMPGSVIAGYVPLRGEVACTRILEALNAMGHILCLPVVVGRDEPMIFRTWKPGDHTRRGQMGQSEPEQHKPQVFPDIMIIPMLGFTRKGHRLGYGSGFYDRTLAAFKPIKPVKTIGLAYSIQEAADMVIDPHDVPLDVIITENGVIKPQ